MLAIIQARMSSTRLPGKVFKELAGKPMLQWTLERLGNSKMLKKVVVATSMDSGDNVVEEFCREKNVNFHRGPLENVALRFAEVITLEQADAFVRINGDSPLIDPIIIDQAVSLYQSTTVELVTNIMPRTFPKGQSVEVINSEHFQKLCKRMTEPTDQEHVTKGFYNNSEKHRIVSFTSGIDAGHVQLSVDTLDDFVEIEKLIKISNGQPEGWKELLSLKSTL
jgi:spore coat polysaccharide biosynthesis protein SpsF